jgi:hypothetical protein
MNIVKQIVKAAQEDLKIKNSNTTNGINILPIEGWEGITCYVTFFQISCF